MPARRDERITQVGLEQYQNEQRWWLNLSGEQQSRYEDLAAEARDLGMSEEVILGVVQRLADAAGQQPEPQAVDPQQQQRDSIPITAQPPQARPLPPDKEARLRLIETVGTEEFKRWMAGDEKIRAERDEIYNQKFPGVVSIDSDPFMDMRLADNKNSQT